jgi:peptidyl-prolyl cis-trans isomerase SurA
MYSIGKNGKFFFLAGAIIFCLFLTNSAEARKLVDRIVAVVNDDVILLSELHSTVKPYLKKMANYNYPPEKEEMLIYKIREDMLDKLISEKLTDQQVEKYGITVSKQEVDAAIERVKQANRLTDETFRQAILEQGMSMEEYRDHMREQITRSHLLDLEVKSRIVVTDEDIKACYLRDTDEYCDKRKYHLRTILMKVPAGAEGKEKEKIRNQMMEIQEKLEQGHDFTEMAAKYGEPSLVETGGYLGAFEPDSMALQIKNAVLGLKEGEVTPLLETDQGFQILRVDKIEMVEKKTLEEVSDEIVQRLYREILDQKFTSWLENLKKQSYIKIIR